MGDPSGRGRAALPEIHIRPTECITAKRKERKENSAAAKRHTAAPDSPSHSKRDVSALPSGGGDGGKTEEGVFGDTPPLFLLAPENRARLFFCGSFYF